jgi:TetR/AcrR family transcriptional regulator
MLRPSAPPGSKKVEPVPAVPPSIPPRSEPIAGARPERNAAATKLRILDAGEREFAARGFAGARLREIAEAARVQPALIHHYFTDKQGLYRAVLDRALLPTSTESWSLLGSRHDLEGLLAGFIELLLRFYAANRNLLSILRHEALSGSSVLVELTKERTLPIIGALSRFLEERQAAGEVRADVPASEIIVAGMSMVVYPFVEEGILQVMMPSVIVLDERSLERRKHAILELLMRGIRPSRKRVAGGSARDSSGRPVNQTRPKGRAPGAGE